MPFKQTHQPRWNSLVKILALLLGLLAVETRARLTPSAHKLILLALMILAYSLIGLWIQSNAEALQTPAHKSRPKEIWRSDPVEWNNRKEAPSGGLDRLDDERSFDTLQV